MSRADLGDPEIGTVLTEVKSNAPTNWMLLGHVAKSDNKYKVLGKGSGGLAELQENLNDGKVLFGLLKVDLSGVKKFVFISWCGEGVTGMKKGLFANHSNDVALLFKGFHVQINARSENDVQEKDIMHRIKTATGARFHKQLGDQTVENAPDKSSITYEKRDADQSTENAPVKSTISYDKRDYDQSTESAPAPSSITYEKRGSDQSTENKPATSRFNPPQQVQQQGQPARPTPGRLNNPFQGGAPKQTSAPAPSRPGPPPTKQAPPPAQAKPVAPPPAAKPAPPPPTAKPAPPPQPEPEPEPVQESYPEETQDQQYTEDQQYNDQQYNDQQYTEDQQYNDQQYNDQQYTEDQQYNDQSNDQQYNDQQYNQDQSGGGYAKAIYDYEAENPDDLSFKEGDMITVLDKSDSSGWWEGELNGKRGFFPSNFVEEQQ